MPPPHIRTHLLSSVHAHLEEFTGSNIRSVPNRARSNNVDVYVQNPNEIHRRVPRLDRKVDSPLTHDEWGQLAGAQPGARVHVYPKGFGGVEVVVDHPDYRTRSELRSGKVIRVSNVKVSRQKQGQGITSRALSKQVEAASKLGYRSIELTAAGSGNGIRHDEEPRLPGEAKSSGFYAWARLGFDGKIRPLMNSRKRHPSQELHAIAADFDKQFPGVTNVSQMMATKKGRAWWKKYGGGFEGKFDLTEGSQSRRVLAQYLAEKDAQKKRKSLVAIAGDRGTGRDNLIDDFDNRTPAHPQTGDWSDELWCDWNGSDWEHHDSFSADDEEILDKIWDRIGRETGGEPT